MDITAPSLLQPRPAKAQSSQSQHQPDSLLFSGRKKSKTKAVEWKKRTREALNLDTHDTWQKAPSAEVKPEPAEDCLVWVDGVQLPDGTGDDLTLLKLPPEARAMDLSDWKPILPELSHTPDWVEEADQMAFSWPPLPQWPAPTPELVQSVMAAVETDAPIPQGTLDAYDQQRGVSPQAASVKKNHKRKRPMADKPELHIYESILPPFDEAYYRHNPFKKSYLERQALLAQPKSAPMIADERGVQPELSLQVLQEMLAALNQLPMA